MDQIKSAVLLVEDEPLILIHARLALEDAGFAVVPAADADEAIAALDAYPGIDAMLIDVNLPGDTDGIALARQVREDRPEVATVLMSGQSVDPADVAPLGPFLSKPYTAAQLGRAMDAAA